MRKDLDRNREAGAAVGHVAVHSTAEHVVLGGVPCRVVVLAHGGARARPEERAPKRRRW